MDKQDLWQSYYPLAISIPRETSINFTMGTSHLQSGKCGHFEPGWGRGYVRLADQQISTSSVQVFTLEPGTLGPYICPALLYQ